MSNHILIIEDDTAIAEVLRLNLECADYTVTAFDNGLAAWNALAADHDYDLALLDMMLPGGGRLYLAAEASGIRNPRHLPDRHERRPT